MLDCIFNSTYLYYRIKAAWAAIEDIPEPSLNGDIWNINEIYEILLAFGNVSWQYQDCWIQADNSVEKAVNWSL